MLKTLYIDNFRCLVNFELKFSRIALLMGLNGSGKSSVFEALFRLRQFITGEGKVNQLFPARDLTRWQTIPNQTFSMELEGNGGFYTYELVIEHNIEKRLQRIKKEKLAFNNRPLYSFQDATAQLYHDDHVPGPQASFDWTQSGLSMLQDRPDNKKLTWFKNHIKKFIIISLDPGQMGSDSGSEEESPSRNMGNFASWYRYLSQEHQANIIDLTNQLREILPGFNSFSLPQSGEEHRTLQVGFFLKESEKEIVYRFDELSDGQRTLIALYTLIFGLRKLDCSIFIDEPENFLALPELQPWLTTISDASGRSICQTIIISHHPEFIDYLSASSGIFLEREFNGPVRVKDKSSFEVEGLKTSQVIERGWQT